MALKHGKHLHLVYLQLLVQLLVLIGPGRPFLHTHLPISRAPAPLSIWNVCKQS